MNELVKLVSQKAGIPEATALVAVQTVLGYLKQYLPAPLAAQVDMLLAASQTPNPGASTEGDQLSSALNMLGGMFGGQK